MKRLVSLALAALFCAFVALPAAVADSYPSGVIVGGSASVFDNNPPMPGEPSIAQIPYGAQVAVRSTVGQMCYVFYYKGYGGAVVQGWVYRDQVRVERPDPTFPPGPYPTVRPTPAPTRKPTHKPTAKPTAKPAQKPAAHQIIDMQPGVRQGAVLCNTLVLKQTPSAKAKNLATVPNGAVVFVNSEKDGWLNITYTDNAVRKSYTGWVTSDYILLDPFYITAPRAVTCYAVPDADGRAVGMAQLGVKLLVICEFGDFYAVSLYGASAFVLKADVGR